MNAIASACPPGRVSRITSTFVLCFCILQLTRSHLPLRQMKGSAGWNGHCAQRGSRLGASKCEETTVAHVSCAGRGGGRGPQLVNSMHHEMSGYRDRKCPSISHISALRTRHHINAFCPYARSRPWSPNFPFPELGAHHSIIRCD